MSVTGSQRNSATGFLRSQATDIFAGLVASVISVAYGLSFAALIFAPPLSTLLAYGIAATFITTAISASIVAARSSVPFAISGTSLAEAQAQGWLFKAPAAVGLTPTWDLDDLRTFPWKYLPGLSGDLFAVMFVTAISTLLNTTGIEFVTTSAS